MKKGPAGRTRRGVLMVRGPRSEVAVGIRVDVALGVLLGVAGTVAGIAEVLAELVTGVADVVAHAVAVELTSRFFGLGLALAIHALDVVHSRVPPCVSGGRCGRPICDTYAMARSLAVRPRQCPVTACSRLARFG